MTSSLLLLVSFTPFITSFVLPPHRPNIPVTLPPSHHRRTVDFTFGVNEVTPEAPPTFVVNDGLTPEQRVTFGMNDEDVTFASRDVVTPESLVVTMEDDEGVTPRDSISDSHHGTDSVSFDGLTVGHRRSPPPLFTEGIIRPITRIFPTEPPMVE